ncbi:hypothetical protein [Prosthecobacter sp.]|uniref:hypothetical protein n=1 Tax=Prosthecobacter sp. TaxID=1965333 RepID=UPI003783A572
MKTLPNPFVNLVNPFVTPIGEQRTVMPLDKQQAAQVQEQMGPPLRVRPLSAGNASKYAQKTVKDPRWGLMTVDDKTRPVFTDPKGGHTVGSSTQSLGALGGPTLMPNMTAPGANFSFGMGRDDRSQRSIDGSIPHGADPFGHQFGDPFQGGADAYGKPDPFMADGSRNPFYMAEGGPVVGPGGPTDDKIPAKLSNGEHVDKASTVLWLDSKPLTNWKRLMKDWRAERPTKWSAR